jgi:serine O-acetyltransferase
MAFSIVRDLIFADLYRDSGKSGWLYCIKQLFWGTGSCYTIWMRLSAYFANKPVIYFPLHQFVRFMRRHYMYKFGLYIPAATNIGPGLFIGHVGGIVVSVKAVIGKNCNISQGVTIGVSYHDGKAGYPVIGDNVYIGPGAKIFGNIKIGNNVAIGANAVVNKDAPDNAVVVGVPSKVISLKGSFAYINNTDYNFG